MGNDKPNKRKSANSWDEEREVMKTRSSLTWTGVGVTTVAAALVAAVPVVERRRASSNTSFAIPCVERRVERTKRALLLRCASVSSERAGANTAEILRIKRDKKNTHQTEKKTLLLPGW